MMNYTLITGASSGIGYEFSKVFAKERHNLVLVARSKNKLLQLKSKLEQKYGVSVFILDKDLTSLNAVQEIFDLIQSKEISIDILINNAGFGYHSGFLDSNWYKQKNMIELNIIALMEMTYVFGNEMRIQGYGRILNLSSAAAFSSGPYMSIYYASKGFVLSFSEALAEELKGTGVTVTALCPGPTATGFETAADMKNSKMFTLFKPASASDVAKSGYKALMSGKTVKYHSIPTQLMNIGARLSPRNITRKFAKSINGIPRKE